MSSKEILKYPTFNEYLKSQVQTKLTHEDRYFLERLIENRVSRKQMFQVPLTKYPMMLNSLLSRTPAIGRKPYRRLLEFGELLFDLSREYEVLYEASKGKVCKISKLRYNRDIHVSINTPNRARAISEDLTGFSEKTCTNVE
ncbi:hypothetical protein [Clostridium perfringens]|uniref:hypothetical protein n=1 Tax=Clostridium perfringens TaxID=1502 RepID=UPI0024BCE6B2|nr:hypothetical protein [Clostridium perfringens]